MCFLCSKFSYKIQRKSGGWKSYFYARHEPTGIVTSIKGLEDGVEWRSGDISLTDRSITRWGCVLRETMCLGTVGWGKRPVNVCVCELALSSDFAGAKAWSYWDAAALLDSITKEEPKCG